MQDFISVINVQVTRLNCFCFVYRRKCYIIVDSREFNIRDTKEWRGNERERGYNSMSDDQYYRYLSYWEVFLQRHFDYDAIIGSIETYQHI